MSAAGVAGAAGVVAAGVAVTGVEGVASSEVAAPGAAVGAPAAPSFFFPQRQHRLPARGRGPGGGHVWMSAEVQTLSQARLPTPDNLSLPPPKLLPSTLPAPHSKAGMQEGQLLVLPLTVVVVKLGRHLVSGHLPGCQQCVAVGQAGGFVRDQRVLGAPALALRQSRGAGRSTGDGSNACSHPAAPCKPRHVHAC